jgi:steroid delta-isomerase-like uncharacterized protein
MSDENKTIVRRLYLELWNHRKLGLAEDLFAPSHALSDPNLSGAAVGPEAYKRQVTRFLTGFPDLRFTIDDMVCEDDKVVVSWIISGTHQGEFMGILATGKKVSVSGITIIALSHGKILDSNVIYDALGLAKQLGVTLPAGLAKGASADR